MKNLIKYFSLFLLFISFTVSAQQINLVAGINLAGTITVEDTDFDVEPGVFGKLTYETSSILDFYGKFGNHEHEADDAGYFEAGLSIGDEIDPGKRIGLEVGYRLISADPDDIEGLALNPFFQMDLPMGSNTNSIFVEIGAETQLTGGNDTVDYTYNSFYAGVGIGL